MDIESLRHHVLNTVEVVGGDMVISLIDTLDGVFDKVSDLADEVAETREQNPWVTAININGLDGLLPEDIAAKVKETLDKVQGNRQAKPAPAPQETGGSEEDTLRPLVRSIYKYLVVNHPLYSEYNKVYEDYLVNSPHMEDFEALVKDLHDVLFRLKPDEDQK